MERGLFTDRRNSGWSPAGIRQFFRRRLGILALLCLVLSAPSAFPAPRRGNHARLNARVDAILQSSDAFRGFWGIEVAELPGGRILFNRDAQHLFHPASNMKLFTTAAALAELGPDFVFRTTVESLSEPDAHGRVSELYLVGRGDPTLGESAGGRCPALQDLAAQVRKLGVLEITGPLVADDSYFLYEPYGRGWTADDLLWGYAAPVSALSFNGNALQLRARPGPTVGGRAQVWLDPLADYYHLNNHLETGAAGSENRLFVERGVNPLQLDIWGKIPLDNGEAAERVAIAHPQELVGELFRQALEDAGIHVRGGVEIRQTTRPEAAAGHPPPQPASRVVLAEHNSPPLREIVKVTNKESRNFYAEVLVRTLAREVKQSGSLEDGLGVLNKFAEQAGAGRNETVFADGSGLSRDNLVTPEALVKLLIYMARSPVFGVFFETLPVAGADGTLAGRFQGTRAEGKIHAKTGTEEQVNALSGYMDMASGKRLVFSIMGNAHPLNEHEGAATVDRIALAVYEAFSRRKPLGSAGHPLPHGEDKVQGPHPSP